MKLHFPHISRLFSANKSIPLTITVCWSVLTACIIINARLSSAYGTVIQNVEDTMKQTHDGGLLRSLSDRFEKSGMMTIAQELRQSNDVPMAPNTNPSKDTKVLGSQTRSLEYWKNILEEHPDYRDAYLSAAKSALAENNTKEALVFINQALEIDPNDKVALVLATILEKNISK
jgi:Flp pilus assembly protein TadD